MLSTRPAIFSALLSILTFATSANAQQQVIVTQSKTPSGATFTNYETVGNLASTHSLKCMPVTQIKNEYSPADIYLAFVDCVRSKRYEEATNLFIAAGTYGAFDKLRVADRTAHQAPQMLILTNTAAIDKTLYEEWRIHAKKQFADKDSSLNICNSMRHLGAPNYYPAYMIQHGMQAFTNNSENKPLIEPFNSQEAWNTALDKYAHCPVNK